MFSSRSQLCKSAVALWLLGGIVAAAQVGQTVGPDVIVGDIGGSADNNPTAAGGVLYDSFAVGTLACNRGDLPLHWRTGGADNRHPVISQGLFRYHDGRFRQIGQSSVKHGFFAVQDPGCAGYFTFGCAPAPGPVLGPGCSDAYSATMNNVSGFAGPRWQVNAATGLFPYPYPAEPASGPIRARLSELNAGGVQAGAGRYFVEVQYVTADDAAAGNSGNNCSWREVAMEPLGVPPDAFNFSLSDAPGPVHPEQPVIHAWKSVDPAVTFTEFNIPDDGRMIVGCRVSGTGPYRYEYAVQNVNSHRCAASFVVPLPGAQAPLSGIGFHDAEAVGEPNAPPDSADPASDDWTVSGGDAAATSVAWIGPRHIGSPPVHTSDPADPHLVTAFTPGTGNDHSANVLRWGTLFNFSFVSDLPPGDGSVAVGLWRPGGPSAALAPARTPGGATVGPLTGACCTGPVCSVSAQESCGGEWGPPGSACAPDPCVSGACCFRGACSTTVRAACHGAWAAGGACSPNPCPPPTGACCVDDSCRVVVETACAGSWQGVNSTCGTVHCPAGNDACAGALVLCDGAAANGTTTGFTGDGAAGCGSSSSSADAWYRYTPAISAAVNVNTCGSYFDTVLAVYTGSCGSPTEIACNDESFTGNSACGDGSESGLDVLMTAGTPYLIRIAGYQGAAGPYTLRISGGAGRDCGAPGACCTGPVCALTTGDACAGAYLGPGSVCAPASGTSPCCPADFNRSGGLDVADIFAFLRAWFANSPSADFDGMNGIQVADIFSFLRAWFAGC